MSTQDLLYLVYVVGAAGIWVFVIWFGKALAHLKSMTDSMQSVFTSMNIGAEYLETVLKTGRSLYDPAEIEHLVTARVDAVKADHKKAMLEVRQVAISTLEQIIEQRIAQQGYYFFAALAIFHLGEQQIALIMKTLSTSMDPAAFRQLSQQVETWQAERLASRHKALQEALKSIPIRATGISDEPPGGGN